MRIDYDDNSDAQYPWSQQGLLMSFLLKSFKEDIGRVCRCVNSPSCWKWVINTTQHWQADHNEKIWHYGKVIEWFVIAVLWANLVPGCEILHSALSRVAVLRQQFGHKQRGLYSASPSACCMATSPADSQASYFTDWLSDRQNRNEWSAKNILSDRPTLASFGVADRVTTGIVLGQIRTSFNGRGKPPMVFPDSSNC